MTTRGFRASRAMTAQEAINRLGGTAAAARALGLKRTAVHMWRRNETVPAKHALTVARALSVPVATILDPAAPVPQREDQAA